MPDFGQQDRHTYLGRMKVGVGGLGWEVERVWMGLGGDGGWWLSEGGVGDRKGEMWRRCVGCMWG